MNTITRSHYLWAVRRELWENRFIYVGPIGVALLFLLGYVVSAVPLPEQIRALATPLSAGPLRAHVTEAYALAEGLMMLTGMILGAYYCLEALYGERRDRSILFWKSLPVSDLSTVLAKASIPFLVLPLLVVALTVALHAAMLLLGAVELAVRGQDAGLVLSGVPLAESSVGFFRHLFVIHVLLAAPFYGWLLLVSAWAPRVPLVWAVLPPLAIGYLEKIALGTTRFFDHLLSRFMGADVGSAAAARVAEPMTRLPVSHVGSPHPATLEPLMQLPASHLLSSTSLWFGLAVTAAFLAAAARVRRVGRPV